MNPALQPTVGTPVKPGHRSCGRRRRLSFTFGGLGRSMNPVHAVDVYVDAATLEAAVFRRRDGLWWRSGGGATPHLLGRAVSEALRPGPPAELAWEVTVDGLPVTTDNRQVVVIWRQDHRTIVATPYCDWGRAQDIVLGEMPAHGAMGEAILQQVRISVAAAKQ